jgi:transposase
MVGRRGVEQLLNVAAGAGDKRLPEVARAGVTPLGAQLKTLKAQILLFDRLTCTSEHSCRSERIANTYPTISIRIIKTGSIEGRPVCE